MPQTLKFSQSLHNGDIDSGSNAEEAARQDDAAKQDEARMRRALGMIGDPARQPQPDTARDRRLPGPTSSGSQSGPARAAPASRTNAVPRASATPRRHRFVQDGDVPVTVMRGRPDHMPDVAQPGGSPVNRLDAMQSALAAEQAARERAERSLEEAQAMVRDLRTKLAHMELAREEALAPAPAPVVVEPPEEIAAEQAVPPEKPVRRTRGPGKRPAKPRAAKEPQPVKWWVKPRAKRLGSKLPDPVA